MAEPIKKNVANVLDIANFIPDDAPADAASLVTEENIFASSIKYKNPKTGKDESYPVDGWLVDAQEMNSPKYGPFTGFIFLLAKPTAVPKTPGSTEARLVPAGSKVIIPGKTKLIGELSKFIGREKVARLWLKPLDKIKTGQGHDLENWEVRFVSADARADVEKGDGVVAMLGDVLEAKQLPAAEA